MIERVGIRATRIHPIVEIPSDARVCRRCGIGWDDSRYRYMNGAPCPDCREILERDGEDLAADVRPQWRDTYRRGLERRRRRYARERELDDAEIAA